MRPQARARSQCLPRRVPTADALPPHRPAAAGHPAHPHPEKSMFFGGLPPGFEDAFGGGGMPGGMGGGRRRGPVENSKLYEVRRGGVASARTRPNPPPPLPAPEPRQPSVGTPGHSGSPAVAGKVHTSLDCVLGTVSARTGSVCCRVGRRWRREPKPRSVSARGPRPAHAHAHASSSPALGSQRARSLARSCACPPA